MILPSAAQAPLHEAVANAALTAVAHAVSTTAATTPSPYPYPPNNHTLTDHGSAGGHDSKQGDWSSIIGITTAIVGNILISFALNTQKYAHLRLAHEAEERRQQRRQRKQSSSAAAAGGLSRNPDEEMANKANAKARKILGFKLGSDDVEDDDDDEDGEARETDALLGGGQHSHDEDQAGSDEEDTAYLEAQAKQLRNPRKQPTSYLESPYWWIGIVLMIVGEAGNFLAYGFAPASIVSPLGVVALISNCIIAPIMLKEPFRKRDFLGVLISIGGAVTVVLSAQDNNPKLGPHEIWDLIKTWEFETYFGVTLITICGLMWASTKYGKKSIFIDLGLVGLFGGYTALSTKGVASMLSYTLLHALTFPVTYLLVVILVFTAVMQIKYLNRALQRFNATQVIPTQFVLFTLSVILGSAILYRDFERTNGKGAGEFVGGCLMTFMGVWVITTGRPRDDDEEEEEEEEEEEHAVDPEHSIHLGAEEYGDDEVHYGPTTYSQDDLPTMSTLTPYASAGSHPHRRPSVHRLSTPHITFTSDPPSQAVTATTTPAGPPLGLGSGGPDEDSLTANPWADESLISSLTANRGNNQAPLLHATSSSPILPSEAQALTNHGHSHAGQRPDSSPRRDTSPVATRSSSQTQPQRPSTPPTPSGGGHLRRKSLTTPSPSKRPQPSPMRPSETEPATPSSAASLAATKTPSSHHHHHHLKRGSISHLVPGPLTSPLSSSLSAVVADSLRKGVEMRSLPGQHHGRPRRGTKDSNDGFGGVGGFGGWLSSHGGGGGGASVAGPRDGASDASKAVARRRSRGISQSEGVVVGEGGRARSSSNPFGALLKKVVSRGDGEDDGAEGSGEGSGGAQSGAETPRAAVVAEEQQQAEEEEGEERRQG